MTPDAEQICKRLDAVCDGIAKLRDEFHKANTRLAVVETKQEHAANLESRILAVEQRVNHFGGIFAAVGTLIAIVSALAVRFFSWLFFRGSQ